MGKRVNKNLWIFKVTIHVVYFGHLEFPLMTCGNQTNPNCCFSEPFCSLRSHLQLGLTRSSSSLPTPSVSCLPFSCVWSCLAHSTVSPPAEPVDVHRPGSAGCYHGSKVPLQFPCHSRGSQHPAWAGNPCCDHSHC